jgi:transposase InsO family protein
MSSYYYDPKVSRSEKEEWEADLRGKIEQIRITHPKTGYRTLLRYLKRSGVFVSEYKLRKVMKLFSLGIKPKRRYVRTTNSQHGFQVYPNLLKDFKTTKMNQVWVSDITYIRIENGFVYLAVVLDLFSRRVIGYSISKKIDSELTLNALKMAFARRKFPVNVIHHSDRGVQYLCEKYVVFLKQNKTKISCAEKGNPYENAFAESFMKTLKVEEVYLYNFVTMNDVLERIPEFIEDVYNKKRIHSSLDYLTPEEFETKHQNKKTPCSKNKKSVTK